jgi:hypothetical protein
MELKAHDWFPTLSWQADLPDSQIKVGNQTCAFNSIIQNPHWLD